MPFSDYWSRDKANLEAQDFFRSGSVAGTGNVSFSNIDTRRSGCTDSSDCASGWRCVGGYCISPQNTPASVNNNSINDQGCGSNEDPGGGGCAPSAADGLGSCVKTGCGQPLNDTQSKADCCGDVRCCRFDRFGVRCSCGECPEDEECDKFCSSYRNAVADGAPGCSDGTECDECTSCELFSFQGTKNTYKCKPKSNAPCWCRQEENQNVCGDCEYCSERGACFYDREKCDPVYPPKEPPLEGDPCIEYETYNSICTEIGGPRTSAGTCTAGGGRVTSSWNTGSEEDNSDDGGDKYECVGCIYTDRSGNCEPEDCDCNCNNDCKDCEICSASGECVDDPLCSGGTWTFLGTQMQGGGIVAIVSATITQDELDDGWQVYVNGVPAGQAGSFSPTGELPCSPGGGCTGIDVKPVGADVCTGATFGCGMFKKRGETESESLIGPGFAVCPSYNGQPVASPDQGCNLIGAWEFVPSGS